MLLMVAGIASATQVPFHVIVTNTTVFAWTDSNTPVICGHGTNVNCNLTVNVSATSDTKILKQINGNLTIIYNKVKNINNTVSSSVKNLLTTTQATNLLNRLKDDVTANLASVTDTKLNPYIASSDLVNEYKINLTRDEGQITTLSNQLLSANDSLDECKSGRNDLTNATIVLLVVLAFFVLRQWNMLPGFSKKRPTPRVVQ